MSGNLLSEGSLFGKFSPKTIEKLGWYVYIYSDPDTMQPFYVGKGKGNRVFDHLKDDRQEREKVQKIKEISARGKTPLIEILVHGLDEDTAFKVEAAVIDLIGIDNLTNIQRGHESSTYGRIDVETLDARYSSEELTIDDFDENVMLIRINKHYHNGMKPYELYEVTRGCWRVSRKQVEKVKYVMPIFQGTILEVYEPVEWFHALATITSRPEKEEDREKRRNTRSEFVGNFAPEEIRKRYKNKSVTALFKKGQQYPIYYIDGGSKGITHEEEDKEED